MSLLALSMMPEIFKSIAIYSTVGVVSVAVIALYIQFKR